MVMRKLHPEFESERSLWFLEEYYQRRYKEDTVADAWPGYFEVGKLFADQDPDVQKAPAEPEEEPRVVRETHQLPHGFRLESEWYPEGNRGSVPYLEFEWWGPAGLPNADDPKMPLLLSAWYEKIPSGKGDDARDCIRGVVAKYTEVLGD